MHELLRKFRVLFFDIRRVHLRGRPAVPCPVCGRRWPRLELPILSDQLIRQWQIDQTWRAFFDQRDGLLCFGCRSSPRNAQLAMTLLAWSKMQFQSNARSMRDWVCDPAVATLSIAEMNSCGSLHAFLKKHPRLCYSEYGSTDPRVRSENLLQLTYADDSFDLIVTSDTLEHVPDFDRALKEIHRVLKPGGWHVFTIPIVLDGRPTRRRAEIRDGKIEHLLPPSYHGRPGETKTDYLVFNEFGQDIFDRIRSHGFEVQVETDSENRALISIVSRKPV